MYSGRPSPLSILSFSFACAMSLPTIIVPFKRRNVETGYWLNCSRISFIGRFKSTLTPFANAEPDRYCSGIRRAGFASKVSSQIPSLLIFAFTFLSALQLTPIPTGQEAPWRGRRITLISCAKYFPPNCAPMPRQCAALRRRFSISTSLNAYPSSLAEVGRES